MGVVSSPSTSPLWIPKGKLKVKPKKYDSYIQVAFEVWLYFGRKSFQLLRARTQVFFGDYYPIHYPVGGASVVEMGKGARSAIRTIQQELMVRVCHSGSQDLVIVILQTPLLWTGLHYQKLHNWCNTWIRRENQHGMELAHFVERWNDYFL